MNSSVTSYPSHSKNQKHYNGSVRILRLVKLYMIWCWLLFELLFKQSCFVLAFPQTCQAHFFPRTFVFADFSAYKSLSIDIHLASFLSSFMVFTQNITLSLRLTIYIAKSSMLLSSLIFLRNTYNHLTHCTFFKFLSFSRMYATQ